MSLRNEKVNCLEITNNGFNFHILPNFHYIILTAMIYCLFKDKNNTCYISDARSNNNVNNKMLKYCYYLN